MDTIYVLTYEYSDQCNEFFSTCFLKKPSVQELCDILSVNEEEARHILNGGGRRQDEYHWYNLELYEANENVFEISNKE